MDLKRSRELVEQLHWIARWLDTDPRPRDDPSFAADRRRFWETFNATAAALYAANRRRRTLDRLEAGLRRLDVGLPYRPREDDATTNPLFAPEP